MIQKSVNTYWIKLYLSGPIEIAKQVLREECLRAGLCVTIEPTDFIYTGGEEKGYVVGLINYPRFPCNPSDLNMRAIHIANLLLEKTFQHSILIMSPTQTVWISKRIEEPKKD